MKRIVLILTVVGGSCIGCNHALTKDGARNLIEQSKIFPRDIIYDVYCGSTETALRLEMTTLVDDGYVVVHLKKTSSNIGEPLIDFQLKAKPFLLETPTRSRALDVQRVRLGSEYFGDITGLDFSADGRNCIVTFVTMTRDPTPFAILPEDVQLNERSRQLGFRYINEKWQMDSVVFK